MKSKRKLLSILIAVIIMAAIAIPFPANASEDIGSEEISGLTWAQGYLNQSGNIHTSPANSSTVITSSEIDISNFSKLKITVPSNSYSTKVFWYDANGNYLSVSKNPEHTYGYYPGNHTYEVVGSYARINLTKSGGINPSNAADITVSGIYKAMPVINTKNKGTLTVHKYEMQDTSQLIVYGKGEEDDIDNVPQGAKPIGGVTFQIKKIADVESSYFRTTNTNNNITSLSLPTPAEANNMSAIEAPLSQTTASNGEATFNNLSLGIYLVKETKAPSNVTQKMPDIVVAIPTTKGTTGNEWNYNVHIYPKNETKYKNITIKKEDHITHTGLSGATFTLERSEDNTTWSEVETLTTTSNGTIQPTKLLGVNTYYRITETIAPNKYILDKQNNRTVFYLDDNGNICNPSTKAVISSGSDMAPAQLTVTNSKPSIEKYIDKSKGSKSNLVEVSALTYSKTDKNSYYTFKVTTPNVTNMASIKTFNVTDRIAKSNHGAPELFRVEKADGALLTKDTDYSYTTTLADSAVNNKKYDTTVSFVTSRLLPNTTYYITIKAHLEEDVSNTANVVYSKIADGSSGETETIQSNTVNLYYYGYKFKKVNEKDEALSGVEFKVFDSYDNAIAQKNPLVGKEATNTDSVTDTFTSDNNGEVAINYLPVADSPDGEKDFWVVETKTVSGYNLLSKPFKITVNRSTANECQISVVNIPNNGFPITGGQGLLLIILFGSVILVSSTIILIIISKQKKQ